MAKVFFKRIESSSDINNVAIIDGQIIYTKDGKTYIDYENERVVINGTPETEMSDVSTNAVANSTIKQYVDNAIANVENQIEVSEILWTNHNPNESFSAQEITLNKNLDNYDTYEILFLQSTSTNRIMTTGNIPVGYGTILEFITIYPKYRPTEVEVSGSSITFEECRSLNNIGSFVSENSSIIPIYVIGHKTNLFNN